jgi:hypothetical protein
VSTVPAQQIPYAWIAEFVRCGIRPAPQPTTPLRFTAFFNALLLLLSPDSVPKFQSESAAASSPIPAPEC